MMIMIIKAHRQYELPWLLLRRRPETLKSLVWFALMVYKIIVSYLILKPFF